MPAPVFASAIQQSLSQVRQTQVDRLWQRFGTGLPYLTSIKVFHVQHGHYPKSLDELTRGKRAKHKNATTPGCQTHGHPIMERLPDDPWGKAFRYRNPGQLSNEAFDIISAGKDGTFRTDDDVGNFAE